MPKFSVIIPLYNGEKYIARALDCVKAQTFKDLEVVVCNDGSPDASADIVNNYIRDNRGLQIKLVSQKNRGLGGARNTAIRNAEGEYMALLDQDDIWYPNKLERINEVLEKDPSIDFVCHNEALRKDGVIVQTSSYGPVSPDFYRQLFLKQNCLSTSASTFKKELIERVGYFSEDISRIHFVEDYDLWLKMAKTGARFKVIDDVLGEYVLHEDNFSTNSQTMMYDHEINVLQGHWEEYREKNLVDAFLFSYRIAYLNLAAAVNSARSNDRGQALNRLLIAMRTNPSVIINFYKYFARFLRNKKTDERLSV